MRKDKKYAVVGSVNCESSLQEVGFCLYFGRAAAQDHEIKTDSCVCVGVCCSPASGELHLLLNRACDKFLAHSGFCFDSGRPASQDLEMRTDFCVCVCVCVHAYMCATDVHLAHCISCDESLNAAIW